MNAANKNALSIMNNIIDDYLNGKYSREEAVDKLFFSVDLDVIYCPDSEFMVTDCYYTIKHLTEIGYETTDFELAYFRDCINGVREYDLEEKMALIRTHHITTEVERVTK